MDEDRDPDAIGWNAIDEALRGVYGSVEPKHWGTVVPYALGGPDPLTGLSAYVDPAAGTYWHFITYGFSELYEKESEDPAVSGFGFELTIRVATKPGEDHAVWVFSFLQNLARYVFETGRGFGAGHTMPLNGPIRSGYDTAIQAVTFAIDPDLGQIDTAHGKVKFLQVVGITVDELEAIQGWNAESFIKLVSQQNPKLATDIDRESYLKDKVFASEARARTAKEGASCGELFANEFSFSKTTFSRTCKVRLGAIVVVGLAERIAGRIPFERDLILANEQAAIAFRPGAENQWAINDSVLEVTLTSETAAILPSVLIPRAGTYSIPGMDRLTIHVDKTEIRDNDGNIVDVLG